jgi:LDH2 family malate/lactate/ureidoglycolate dehydrogenase
MEDGRVSPDGLRDFTAAVFRKAGMPEADAWLCSDTLVQADLWGHQSHGSMRLPWYLARLRAGVCQPVARPEIVVDTGAVAVIDGHDGMGQVLAAKATGEAVARAKRHGIAAVALRHSNHFGMAFYYTLMAARQDCVAFLTTNASPAMAPWGGREKAVGNNPWSWACPAGAHAPMVLDIANTAVARGKIYLAKQRGQVIPEGWAIDAAGAPTTDPLEAIAGVILPMAGHKGYAAAVIMDVLSGVLTGSGFGRQIQGPRQADRKSNVGHLMIAMDIAKFLPVEEFGRRVEAQIADLKSVPLALGATEIFYPGEIEARQDRESRRDGLLLPAATLADLQQLAAELGLETLLPFA